MVSLSLSAETKENRADNPHQLRIGIGDDLGTRMRLGHCGCQPDYAPPMPEEGQSVEWMHSQLTAVQTRVESAHALPHFFLDYQYRLKPWFGVGLQTDLRGAWDTRRKYNLYGDDFGTYGTSTLAWAFIPECTFTYLHRPLVNLYSAVGIGYAMEMELTSGKVDEVEHSIALHLTALGLSIGRNHWFGTLELGILSEPGNELFLDRFLSASVGYRF